MKLEHRELLTDSEIRATGDSGKTVGGYAAVFEKLSENLGGFVEKIAPGAFKRAIEEKADVRALWAHDSSIVLGRTTNGTLRLAENTRGLKFELDLPETSAGRDAFISISRGDVSGVSFGFFVRSDKWEFSEDPAKPHVRTLLDIDIFEISPVAFPAYPQTQVSTRDAREVLEAALTARQAQEKATEQTPGRKVQVLKRIVDVFSIE